MKSVLVPLREAQAGMTGTEADIAKYIRSHPSEVSCLTIRQLAERTFSSPSSVLRVCRAAGFQGYKDFRQALLLELASFGSEVSHSEQQIVPEDSIETIIDKTISKNIRSLEDTRHLLNPDTVLRCAGLLSSSRTILLFGLGASLCVARDTYLKFLRLNKPCVINEDWHSQLLQAMNSSPDDVGVVFSYSGQTAEVIQCMKKLRENGTPCIAITRFAPSPVAKLADYVLYAASNESLFRSGAMSSRLSQLAVMDILYAAFVNAEYDYCLRQLARTHIYKEDPSKADFVDPVQMAAVPEAEDCPLKARGK